MTVHIGQVTCPVCLDDTVVVVEQRGADVPVPCPGCCCETCGQATTTPPECLACYCVDDDAYRRRTDV